MKQMTVMQYHCPCCGDIRKPKKHCNNCFWAICQHCRAVIDMRTRKHFQYVTRDHHPNCKGNPA